MSLDFGIRKNGTNICWFTSSEKVTRAVDPKYTEDWTPIKVDSFERAISDLKDEKHKYERSAEKEKEALKYINNTEDIYLALQAVDNIQEEIDDINVAINYLYLLVRIGDDCDYTEEGERIEAVLEYTYG